jgi:hypothetical protein
MSIFQVGGLKQGDQNLDILTANKLSSLFNDPIKCWDYVASLIHIQMRMEHWQNDTNRGK